MDPVNHFEVVFKNKKRAMDFYSGVFGWKLTDMPEMRYVIVHTTKTDKKYMPLEKGVINGGMAASNQSARQSLIVVTVKSIARKIKKIEEMGGKVVMPKVQVGDMGYYARVKDTEGNVVGIWEEMKR